jgi:hypothetical protein
MSIEDYLVNNNINKEKFSKLMQSFDKKLFIPFIGAGTSMPTGQCDWDGLYKKLRKALNTRTRLPKDSENNPDYPKAFSNIYKRI